MSRTIKIEDKAIGEGQPVFIVAEIGLNHNGKLELAKKLVKAAKESGADAVKFQKRDLKSIYKKDVYQNPNKDSQSTSYLFNIFKKFELSKKEEAIDNKEVSKEYIKNEIKKIRRILKERYKKYKNK